MINIIENPRFCIIEGSHIFNTRLGTDVVHYTPELRLLANLSKRPNPYIEFSQALNPLLRSFFRALTVFLKGRKLIYSKIIAKNQSSS